ncbi:MAG: mevalonate kinase [Candidatus Lokiarchaeota archaeon]|nr:mevalonate kinase [Candidatus Lokiarchaeota archaeon]
MGKGRGFGKTILFGDHFVVYGLEGIPCALGQVTTAEVKRIEGKKDYELIDNRQATPGYKEEKKGEYAALIDRILGYLKVEGRVRITLGGDLVPASGIGASAACAVAIARAVNDEYNLGLGDAEINNAAYEGEVAGSGTPSGIDNTAATYGGFLLFKKNLAGGENKIEVLRVKKPVEIVLGNSGKTALTKQVVDDVRKLRKETNIEPIFHAYDALEKQAVEAIKKENWKEVGMLMDKNQELLEKLTVSGKELEEMIAAARAAGAFGAKLTGTGRGGLVICLTPGKELQDGVARAIEGAGYKTIKTVIGELV